DCHQSNRDRRVIEAAGSSDHDRAPNSLVPAILNGLPLWDHRTASQFVEACGEEQRPSLAGETGPQKIRAPVRYTNLMLPTLNAHGTADPARVGKYLHIHPVCTASVVCVGYGWAC